MNATLQRWSTEPRAGFPEPLTINCFVCGVGHEDHEAPRCEHCDEVCCAEHLKSIKAPNLLVPGTKGAWSLCPDCEAIQLKDQAEEKALLLVAKLELEGALAQFDHFDRDGLFETLQAISTRLVAA